MMNGIQGLMQAPGQGMPPAQPQGQPPQAPGQAMPPGQGHPPMPGMQPGAGGPQGGVQSLTPALAQMNKQQLLMEMMNPNSQIPKFALLSAIDQKVKQEKAMQAVQGSMAQQQAQQQQQQGSVAQGVLQEAMQGAPVMARHGGAMHGYAGGGVVAFADGDAVWRKRLLSAGVPETFIVGFEAKGASPEQIESEAKRAGLLSAQTAPVMPPPEVRRSFMDRILAQHEESPISQALFGTIARAARGESAGPLLERPVIETLTSREQPRIPSFAGKSGDPDADIGAVAPTAQIPERLKDTRGIPALMAPPAERPPVTPPPADRPPAATSETDQNLQNYLSSLRTRQGVPEDVAAGRAGLESLVRSEMEARQRRLSDDRKSAEQRRQEAEERAPGVFSPEGLLAIAASIDPRRGYELGSAAKGAFGVMAGQRKAQEEARKEFREFERAERTEQNLLSQMRTLEAQRLQAIREKDVESANAITDQLYSTQREYEKTVREAKDKQEDLAIKRLAAEAEKKEGEAKVEQAKATRDAAVRSRMEGQFSLDVNRYTQALANAEKAHREKYKNLYNLESAGIELKPEQIKAIDKARSEWKATEKQIQKNYLPQINALAKTLYNTPYSDVGFIEYDSEGKRKQQD